MELARACLLKSPRGKFETDYYPVPVPAPGGMLMKIELCGVCGTDVHTWQSEDIGIPYPVSLGHEIVGTVAALGSGVTGDYLGKPLQIGDRIGVIPAIHCHRCYFCTIAKTPEKCIAWKTYGTWPNADQEPHFTGGFGDYLYIHDPNSVVLKMDTTPERGVFLEPMAVVVHALLHAGMKPGDTVAVQGVGPIGLLTVAAAKVCGASRVIAFGHTNQMRLDLAKEMGADLVVGTNDIPLHSDRVKYVMEHSLNCVGADVVFNCVGTAQGLKEAIDYVRNSGTVVEVGNFVDSGTFDFNPCKDLLERGIKIIGSFDNEAEHFVRALPLVSDPRLPLPKLISHRLPLSEVQNVHEAIRFNKGMYKDVSVVKAVIDPSLPD
ncbi:MAG: alcohol dehydrogenase catalytic domain-containing protein [Eubacteriales bacterium]|nr:alcohol dehydrogenase catalytic domain-containing protein [Eubacteriales bacterium]